MVNDSFPPAVIASDTVATSNALGFLLRDGVTRLLNWSESRNAFARLFRLPPSFARSGFDGRIRRRRCWDRSSASAGSALADVPSAARFGGEFGSRRLGALFVNRLLNLQVAPASELQCRARASKAAHGRIAG